MKRLFLAAARRDAAADRLQKEIDRPTSLAESLLQATREEGDCASPGLDSVPLDGLVTDVAQDCEIEASARGCRLTLTGRSHVELRGDSEPLRRAIENIFRNAILHA